MRARSHDGMVLALSRPVDAAAAPVGCIWMVSFLVRTTGSSPGAWAPAGTAKSTAAKAAAHVAQCAKKRVLMEHLLEKGKGPHPGCQCSHASALLGKHVRAAARGPDPGRHRPLCAAVAALSVGPANCLGGLAGEAGIVRGNVLHGLAVAAAGQVVDRRIDHGGELVGIAADGDLSNVGGEVLAGIGFAAAGGVGQTSAETGHGLDRVAADGDVACVGSEVLERFTLCACR